MKTFKEYLLENDATPRDFFVKMTQNKAFKVTVPRDELFHSLIDIKINFNNKEYIFPCRGTLNVIFKINNPLNYSNSEFKEKWKYVDILDIDLNEFNVCYITKHIHKGKTTHYEFLNDGIKHNEQEYNYVVSQCAHEYVKDIIEMYSALYKKENSSPKITKKYNINGAVGIHEKNDSRKAMFDILTYITYKIANFAEELKLKAFDQALAQQDENI
jgi:hypothetical protein